MIYDSYIEFKRNLELQKHEEALRKMSDSGIKFLANTGDALAWAEAINRAIYPKK